MLGAASATAAEAAASSWGAGVEAALPADAGVTDNGVAVDSVSCASTGNCSAVGTYYNDSERHSSSQGLLLTETAGRWTAGVEAVLPANANTDNPAVTLSSVSCASAGNCSAVGTFHDDSSPVGATQGLLLTETAGAWSAGVEAPLPEDAAENPFVDLASVSCTSAGNCTAAGSYFPVASSSGGGGLLLTETAGKWSAVVDPPSPVAGAYVSLTSVSCPAAGDCTAVGSYDGAGLMVTESAGNWEPPVAAALPADAGTGGEGSELDSVSCASAGNCSAAGLYDLHLVDFSKFGEELRGKGLLLTETAGSWGTGVEAVLPANADEPGALDQQGPLSVSCASAGNCSAAGTYLDNEAGLQAVLLTETAGSWGSGVEAMPENGSSSDPATAGPEINAVSCASPGNCGAVATEGALLTETGGGWATGVEPSLPADGAPGYSQLDAVSCVPAGDCTAVGSYLDRSGHEHGLLIGGSPAAVSVDVSKAGTGSGRVSSLPTGIDCGHTCSASFHAGTTLKLTATPAPGSRFSGWSGGGCPLIGKCRLDTGISEQSVTAAFTLLPRCVVPRLKGKTLQSARRTARRHNCAVGKIDRVASRTVERGRVISQKPRPGRELRHGAKLSLVVSEGKR